MKKILIYLATIAIPLILGILIGPHIFSIYKSYTTRPNIEHGDYSNLHNNATPKVVVFTTSTCPFCKNTKELLEKYSIAYIEHQIDSSENSKNLYELMDEKVVPLIIVDDTKIRGFNKTLLLDTLASKKICEKSENDICTPKFAGDR